LIHFEILLQKREECDSGAAKKIYNVYGHDAVSVHVVQRWFQHFQSENFNVKMTSL